MKNSIIAKKSALARSGNNHPLYGKHRSEEVKKKISDANRGRVSNYIDGRTKNKYYCRDCNTPIAMTTALYHGGHCKNCSDKIHSKRMLGNTNSPKGSNNHKWKGGIKRFPKCIDCGVQLGSYIHKRCMRCEGKRRKDLKLMAGKNNPMYGRVTHGIGNKYKKVWMRSSYETKFAYFLDLSRIKWLYEPKAFKLIVDRKETTYTPDFYLPDFACWIEIKGYWRADAKTKFEVFKEQYPIENIIVFNEALLQKIGVL